MYELMLMCKFVPRIFGNRYLNFGWWFNICSKISLVFLLHLPVMFWNGADVFLWLPQSFPLFSLISSSKVIKDEHHCTFKLFICSRRLSKSNCGWCQVALTYFLTSLLTSLLKACYPLYMNAVWWRSTYCCVVCCFDSPLLPLQVVWSCSHSRLAR